MIVMNFFGTSFGLLTWGPGLRFTGSLYYFVFIGVVVTFVLMKVFGVVQIAAK